ncbi:MAG TPA: cyclic nucleotide-binding domain-containing protein [Polyangia bacterium]|nr:cyclic nucleotide-binding domain-containing protein [Polyangia bacterium]
MAIKLRDLKNEARTLARAKQYAGALAAHDHMLALNPLDNDSRRKIADLLLALGDRPAAAQVIRAVAMHDARSGHLLPAIVGCKVLESLGERSDEIVSVLATTFAHESPALAKFAARQSPVDLEAEVAPLPVAAGGDPAAIAQRARDRALDLSAFVQYPEGFLPVPFFSELPPNLFPTAIQSLRLIRAGDGDIVIRQGQKGTAFYFVATGEVRVVARAGHDKAVERGRLHEGALFGEMALLTEQARTASVQVVGEADLLEIDRTTIGRLCAEVPVLNERLDRFARERLLKNLLATSPLFKPFDHQQQMDLLKRFEGHDLEPNTVIIREGDAGQGLFVILLGEVEVLRRDPAGRDKTVAKLGAGEVFGEMSLLGDKPTTATVKTLSRTTIMFLGRDYFRRLVQALPPLRQYFEELSKHRRRARV